MGILVSLIEAGKVDDLKALVAVAKAGLIEVDVDTSKLIIETAKNKFDRVKDVETQKEMKALIRELIELLEVVEELIEAEAEEEPITTTVNNSTVTFVQG